MRRTTSLSACMPMIESPSATTNGRRPTNDRAHSTAWPRPSSLALARVEVLHGRRARTPAPSSSSSLPVSRSVWISSPFRSKWFSIEVLPGPGDEQDPLHADAGQLLDDVLHDRLAADRQHLLRLGLRRGQQARAEAGDGNDGNVDVHGVCRPGGWTPDRALRHSIKSRRPRPWRRARGRWATGSAIIGAAHGRRKAPGGREDGHDARDAHRGSGLWWRRACWWRRPPGRSSPCAGRAAPQAFAADVEKAAILKVMTAAADWQLAHPSTHAPYDWTQAAFYTGMMAFAGVTDDPKYLERDAGDGGARTSGGPGLRPGHADDYAVIATYAQLYQRDRDKRMLAPSLALFNFLLTRKYDEPLVWGNAIENARAGLVRRAVHGAAGDGRGERRDRRPPLPGSRESPLVEDDGLPLRPRRAPLLPRQPLLRSARAERPEGVLEPRQRLGDRGPRARCCRTCRPDYPDRERYVALFREMAGGRRSRPRAPTATGGRACSIPESRPNPETSGTGFFVFALAWGVNQRRARSRARTSPRSGAGGPRSSAPCTRTACSAGCSRSATSRARPPPTRRRCTARARCCWRGAKSTGSRGQVPRADRRGRSHRSSGTRRARSAPRPSASA